MTPPTDADIFALMATRAEKYCPLFGEHKSIPCICGYPSDAQLAVRNLATSNSVGRRLSFEQTDDLRVKLATITAAALAVVQRWDTPLWKDAEPTAAVIARLRDAIGS